MTPTFDFRCFKFFFLKIFMYLFVFYAFTHFNYVRFDRLITGFISSYLDVTFYNLIVLKSFICLMNIGLMIEKRELLLSIQ
ncbi:hypothetical protein EAF07_09360 [Streptococcus hillyeri]|uniref:Uncharacterized protein n=1 Tax=Streptococcus hillyeri TaxID=2282420 RepID=A0A3L9DSE3_9STRE|nr:hypothetical protein EAF07_09360 [Streptococcus hillyeri]